MSLGGLSRVILSIKRLPQSITQIAGLAGAIALIMWGDVLFWYVDGVAGVAKSSFRGL